MRSLLCLVLVFSLFSVGFAQTPDEYYDRAVNKYFLGDNAAAVQYLNRALEIDPEYTKAMDLLSEIAGESLRETEVSVPTTTLAPVVSPVVPNVELSESYIYREKKAANLYIKAHQLFILGEEYFNAENYLSAKEYFLEVIVLLNGHAKSQEYLRQIENKLVPSTPESVVVAAAPVQTYDFRYLLLNFVSALAILFLLVFLALTFRRWRSKYVCCSECGTANPEDAEFCKNCRERLKLPALTDMQRSWFEKFTWKKNPFTLNIISNVFAGHRAEIAIISEKLNTLSGHILIVGGLGTGKTTLLQWLEKNLSNSFETIYISRPPKRPDELIDLISATITNKATHTRKYSLHEFQKLCKKYRRNILLLIDEAHEFDEAFEQYIRSIGDLHNVFLVMAGLPQIREELKRNLPALFDRIVESVLLGSLTKEEAMELIQKRIRNAGGHGLGPFTAASVDKIYEMSYGIPRGILKICDWVVTQSMRANKNFVDVPDVEAYIREIEAAKLEDTESTQEKEES